MAGNSYKEQTYAIDTYNANSGSGALDYPPPAYFYELTGNKPELLLKLDQYSTQNIAIIDRDSFYYKGNSMHIDGDSVDYPYTEFRFRKDHEPEVFNLIDESKMVAYGEFIFYSKNDIYFCGMLSDSPSGTTQGIYHYDIKGDKVDLVFDSETLNGYINNFVFLDSEE